MTADEVIQRHRAAGRTFQAAGVESFVLEAGAGPAVLCLHGVPASSFLYRKVLPELAERGLRGIAFDLPGLGLAERPDDYDYSWSGLGRFAAAAVDALELERFHLVVHDIGGPVGFELAAARPERIRSLTILNTMIAVASFTKPWMMRPFEVPVVGEMWLASMSKFAWRQIVAFVGIANMKAVPRAEIDAYIDLLKRADGGRAFLKIMRGFETTAAKQALYVGTVRDAPYPRQVIWGEQDWALPLDLHGEAVRRAAGLETIHRLPAKHFCQEDQAPALARLIADLARSAGD